MMQRSPGSHPGLTKPSRLSIPGLRLVRGTGSIWRPSPAQVRQARATVRDGLAVHERWLMHLPGDLRRRALLVDPNAPPGRRVRRQEVA